MEQLLPYKTMQSILKRIMLRILVGFLVIFVFSCKGQIKRKGEKPPVLSRSIEQMQKEAKVQRPEPKVKVTVPDFRYAAKLAAPAVVHIRARGSVAIQKPPVPFEHPFKDFFEFEFPERPIPREGRGSGVILTPKGHIVTNYHVIKDAEEIIVTLYDNRSFEATVLGVDPTTDLALLKIDADSLHFIPYGNSDSVEVGEWVLAIGNPFNLSSTVTAGIVSAKARNIHILQDRYAIESFIQTDAAVNPGNSGGALVNLKGELIGINTAIASPTGVYAGYAFAIPVNIVKKVVDDLLNFGEVQRGFLGVTIRDMNSELAEELGIATTEGALVDSVLKNSAAEEAGIKPKDVIIAVDGRKVRNTSELIGYIARKRPGEKVEVTLMRKNKKITVTAVLKSKEGKRTVTAAAKADWVEPLGAKLSPIAKEEAKKLGVDGGLKVLELKEGGVLDRYTDIREGFIITHVNKKPVTSIEALEKALKGKTMIMLQGKYPHVPGTFHYGFRLNYP